MLEAQREFLIDRGNLESLAIGPGAAKPPTSVTEAVGELKVHVALAGVIDLPKLKANLERQIGAKEKAIAGMEGRLNNQAYVSGAPPAQVEETRQLLARARVELVNLREALAGVG
jgi:valyl-tRNA synthetase